MNKFLAIIKDSLIPAFIGIIVGTFYLLAILSELIGLKNVVVSILLSGCIGIFIGSSANLVFYFLKKNIINSIQKAYLIESFVVIILTFIFSYMMGVKDWKYLIIMAFIALFLALWFTHKSFETNDKLKEFQDRFR